MKTSGEKTPFGFKLARKLDNYGERYFSLCSRTPRGQSVNFRKKRGTCGQAVDNTRSLCYPRLVHINSPFDHTTSRKINGGH